MGIWNRLLYAFTRPSSGGSDSLKTTILHAPDIQDSAQAMLCAMRKSESIVAGSVLLDCFSKRMKREKDADGMFRAFQDMYRLYQTNDDAMAMNIAQMLGEKLFKIGHCGVARNENGSKICFMPTENIL